METAKQISPGGVLAVIMSLGICLFAGWVLDPFISPMLKGRPPDLRTETVGVLSQIATSKGDQYSLLAENGENWRLALDVKSKWYARRKIDLKTWAGKKVRVKHRKGFFAVGTLRFLLVDEIELAK